MTHVPDLRAQARARDLARRHRDADAPALLRAMIRDEFPGRLAIVSSFGAESAVILHMVAAVAPATPVIFLETGQLFAQTEAYQRDLTRHLGLQDVRVITPDREELEKQDPSADLWRRDPDACCALRKVRPLARALDGFDAWVTGRKRFHGGTRGTLPLIETQGGRIKINPLAGWSADAVNAHMTAHDLPRHPLQELGYQSIGCHPCTALPAPGDGIRAGRWSGSDKTECGIHTRL